LLFSRPENYSLLDTLKLYDAIRDELKSRGLLERDEKTGSFTRAARTMLYKAKSALVSANAPLAEKDGLIWRK